MEDKEKLRHLLKHWIEHNEEHAVEFREWAVKAKDICSATVSDEILEAANQMEKANEFLDKASTRISNL